MCLLHSASPPRRSSSIFSSQTSDKVTHQILRIAASISLRALFLLRIISSSNLYLGRETSLKILDFHLLNLFYLLMLSDQAHTADRGRAANVADVHNILFSGGKASHNLQRYGLLNHVRNIPSVSWVLLSHISERAILEKIKFSDARHLVGLLKVSHMNGDLFFLQVCTGPPQRLRFRLHGILTDLSGKFNQNVLRVAHMFAQKPKVVCPHHVIFLLLSSTHVADLSIEAI